jgi:hypothetical protein
MTFDQAVNKHILKDLNDKLVDYEFKNYCVLSTGKICDALHQGKVHHSDMSYCDYFYLHYIHINLVAA